MENKKTKYFDKSYITMERWFSYYSQIRAVLETVEGDRTLSGDGLRVLEIGCGNRITSLALSQLLPGSEIKTMDIDSDLSPDILGDIRSIPIGDDSFDIVLAFEVLEHIPLGDLTQALGELARVSRKHVLISVPHSSIHLALAVKMPRTLIRTFSFNFGDISVEHVFDGEHNWELGTDLMSSRQFREKLKEYFRVVDDFRCPLFPYHHFFKLRVD